MKKKIAIFIIIFSFITVGVSWAIFNNKKYKNESITKTNVVLADNYDYCSESFIEKIGNKEFLCFVDYSCYDITTYRYDSLTDTYSVDYMTLRDSSWEAPLIKCPYDSGNITRLIYTITFSPSKKFFRAEYKGFISSIVIENKKVGEYIDKPIKVYYDKSSLKLYNLELDPHFFKNIEKSYNPLFIDNFFNDVNKCIPKYLKI